MQLLSTLNSLDNVADGSTRKLLTTATSSGSGNAVTAVSISGDTLNYTLGETFALANHTHDNVKTSLSSPHQTYYLTGVQITSAGQSDLYNSYLSSNYTGVKYVTSTSEDGGTLYVDDKEVITGLYYEIS